MFETAKFSRSRMDRIALLYKTRFRRFQSTILHSLPIYRQVSASDKPITVQIRYLLKFIAVLIALAALTGCVTSTPTPTATDASTPTAAPTAIPTPTPDPYPMQLEQVGQFGGAADTLAMYGDRVYLRVGQRLVTVDVSDPTNPTIIGRSQYFSNHIASVTALEDHALVEDGDGNLWLFETPTSGDPILVRSFEQSDPNRPQPNSLAYNVVTAGHYRFDLSEEFRLGDDAFLHIYDQSVANDFQADKAIEGLPEGETYAAANLIVRDHYAYAAGIFGLDIYDLSINPEFVVTAPVEGWGVYDWKKVGSLRTDVGTIPTGCCSGVYYGEMVVVEDYLYTLTSTQILVWSLEDPENPILIKEIERPDARMNTLVVKERDAIILATYVRKGVLSVLDTRNPADPVIKEVVLSSETGEIGAIDRNLLFYHIRNEEDTSNANFELHVFDITDLYHPQLISSYLPVPQKNYGQYMVIGNLVYINPAGDEIALDISDPSSIQPANDIKWPFRYNDSVASVDNRLIVLEGNHLKIYTLDNLKSPVAEVTTPTTFVPAGNIPPGHYLMVTDRLAFDSTEFEGNDSLTIIDLQNPESPKLLAQVELHTLGVAAYQDVLYFHLSWDGIGIFRLVPN